MKIEIPQPCPADWNTMKIGAIGRHCQQCEKTVVDFTAMSRQEIMLYLLQHRGQKTCGRFKQSQLDFYRLEQVITPRQLRAMPYNKAITLLSLACLVLASCQNPEITSSTALPTSNTVLVDSSANKKAKAITDSIAPTQTVTNNPAKTVIEIVEMGDIELTGVVLELPPIPEDTAGPFVMGKVPVKSAPDSLNTTENVCVFTEVMPEFPGGTDSLFAFIAQNFVYPETCAHYSGKIYVQFVVEKDGSISNVEILRSPENFDALNKEAVRVFNLMPNWTPGHNRGKPERVRMVLPINLKQD
jgi:hypothetical protein